MPDTAPTSTAPRIWVVLGDKQGDNAQVESIVQALPWDCERRHIQVLDEFVFGKPRVGPTLYHIDRQRTDPLEPPWPDLILTSGRRPANVAMWIREQSGGRTKIIFIGKPSSMPAEVVAPYSLMPSMAPSFTSPSVAPRISSASRPKLRRFCGKY